MRATGKSPIDLPFLVTTPRHLLFTGKGGVGKTSVAGASAVALAERGRRVLLVSTDPASNLDAVLETPLGVEPTPVRGVHGLFALNIDPEQAARDYRERTVAPHRGVLAAAEVALLEERLSGACTVEIAAFDEFALLLADPDRGARFDHVLFDTAPSGHTLRLLALPAAWTGFLADAPGEVSCLGPLSGLKAQHDRYADTVRALADPARTAIVVVARPERVALIEAARTSAELRTQGLSNQHLVINGLFEATDRDDPLALAIERRARAALDEQPAALQDLPTIRLPLLGHNIVGVEALHGLFDPSRREGTAAGAVAPPNVPAATGLAHLIGDVASGRPGMIMVMGKGGVGKSTVAAAMAVALAERGLPTHLTTTDPAEHLSEILASEIPSLRISRIDPKAEFQRYRERTLGAAAASLDAERLALLEEELRSPCYEEVAVYQAFSRVVFGARKEFVVLDTAPTGHTLLLLDTAGAYHRQLTGGAAPVSVRIRTPLQMLQDPSHTRVLIVTHAETTPVLEAEALEDDLERAGIRPYAWVINASLAAARPRDSVLLQRAAAELPMVQRVLKQPSRRVAIIPYQVAEPVGARALLALALCDTAPLERED